VHFVKQKTEFIAYLLTVKTTKQTLAKVIRYIFLCIQTTAVCRKKQNSYLLADR